MPPALGPIAKAAMLVAALVLITCLDSPADAASPFAQAEPRPVTFDDLEGVGNDNDSLFVTMDLSSDGARLAVSRGQVLEVLDTTTGAVLHELGEGARPRWSPADDRLAFYSMRSGQMQLWLWTAAEGTLRPITDVRHGIDPDPTTRITGFAIDAFDFSWSPDGTRLVFASRVSVAIAGQPVGGPLVLDRTTSPDLTLAGIFAQPSGWTGGIAESPDGKRWQYRPQRPGERLVNRLFVTDLRVGATSALDAGAGHLFHPQWSADSTRILFAAIDETDEIQTAASGEIRVHAIAGGNDVVIASGAGMKHQPRWSADERRIAYLLGNSKPDVVVAAVDEGRQEVHPFGRHVLGYRWAHEGNALLLSYPDGTGARLGLLDLEAGNLLPPLVDADIWWLWSLARDGSLVWMEGASGPDVWIRRAGESVPVRLTHHAVAQQEAKFDLGRTETIRYQSAKGEALEGVLLYPPDHDPSRTYPMIVDVYPLSRGSQWMRPMSGNQAWATAGFLVFKPYARAPHVWMNCSGDAGFCSASRGPAAWDVAVDDVMAGIDAVVARGVVDPQRMCLYGFSNGGGMASYLVTRTDRFACAVVVAPALPSWIGAPLLALPSWRMMADWTGTDVLADPAAYVALSSVFRAEHVTTPVLLAAGDQDGMFLLGAIEMYNALRFADADVTLLRYPGQGHVFRGDGLRDLWERQMAFFNRHLKTD